MNCSQFSSTLNLCENLVSFCLRFRRVGYKKEKEEAAIAGGSQESNPRRTFPLLVRTDIQSPLRCDRSRREGKTDRQTDISMSTVRRLAHSPLPTPTTRTERGGSGRGGFFGRPTSGQVTTTLPHSWNIFALPSVHTAPSFAPFPILRESANAASAGRTARPPSMQYWPFPHLPSPGRAGRRGAVRPANVPSKAPASRQS